MVCWRNGCETTRHVYPGETKSDPSSRMVWDCGAHQPAAPRVQRRCIRRKCNAVHYGPAGPCTRCRADGWTVCMLCHKKPVKAPIVRCSDCIAAITREPDAPRNVVDQPAAEPRDRVEPAATAVLPERPAAINTGTLDNPQFDPARVRPCSSVLHCRRRAAWHPPARPDRRRPGRGD